MKTLCVLCFCLAFFGLKVTSQAYIIQGSVYTNSNEILESATVYLNNSMKGTTTDAQGKFELSVPSGTHELIVSYLGYTTISYKLDTRLYAKPFKFILEPKSAALDEVLIKNREYTKREKTHYLALFKNAFIGYSSFAKDFIIKNTDDLIYYYDKETKQLQVESKTPLVLINKSLGYEINYDLIGFESDTKSSFYSGYTQFKKLEGSKRKQRQWKKNRVIAYNGSLQHFLTSVYHKNLNENGFKIESFKKVLNPERPSDSLISISRAIIKAERLKKGFVFKMNKNEPKTKLDSAFVIVRKSRLKKYRNVTLKKDLKTEGFTIFKNKATLLKFKNYLKIIYTNEKEEYNYRPGDARLNYQESSLYLLVDEALIDSTGTLYNPLSFRVEQYWAYEKMPYLLPIGFNPD